MDITFLLIPLALVALVIWGFFWAMRRGQFEDLEGPGHSILMDKDEKMDASYKVRQNKPGHSRLAGLCSLARVSVSTADLPCRLPAVARSMSFTSPGYYQTTVLAIS